MPRKVAPTPEHLHQFRTGQTNAAGRKICGAKNRQGQPCGVTQVMPNGRCLRHGGASLTGIASGTWVTGRHSKYLPARMLDAYHEALTNPELLSLRADMALLEARLAEVLSRVDAGVSGNLWEQAGEVYGKFDEATRAKDTKAAGDALGELGRLLKAGAADWDAWDEVGRLIDRRRSLVESEHRQMLSMQQMISTERAMNLIAAVASIIKERVQDRDTIIAISADLSRLLSVGSPAAANDHAPNGQAGSHAPNGVDGEISPDARHKSPI